MPFLAHVPFTRVSGIAGPGSVVLLPIAAVEQHGPHLPLHTDTIIAEAVAEAVDDGSLDLWVLPTLAYGKSNEHLPFPGTITLTSETLLRVLDEISAGVARAGFSRLAFLNTHGGNSALLTVAARDARVRHGLMVANLQPTPLAGPMGRGEIEIQKDEARYGMHAGRAETSIMLVLRPDLVDLEAAEGSIPPPPGEDGALEYAGPRSVAWLADDLSGNGVLGDPSGATAEEGKVLFDEAAHQVQQALAEFSGLAFEQGKEAPSGVSR